MGPTNLLCDDERWKSLKIAFLFFFATAQLFRVYIFVCAKRKLSKEFEKSRCDIFSSSRKKKRANDINLFSAHTAQAQGSELGIKK